MIMKAVGYLNPLPISDSQSLLDIEIEKPQLINPHDILVQVKAVSVNPVDCKIRSSAKPKNAVAKILGWDASGVVVEVGSNVTSFKVGDEVYYAGDLTRPGTDAEFHLVDERIAGFKPKSLDFEQAAAIPLTALTAYEALFERLQVQTDTNKESILIIGAAGGVGSIAIQLIKVLTAHSVIATASRPETVEWCQKMGADHVINHRKGVLAQLNELGLKPKYVLSLNGTESYLSDIAESIQPQGKFCLIDDPNALDVVPFKRKSVSVHWELMFTRSLYQTEDMIEQKNILNHVGALIDVEKITSTSSESFGFLNAANLKRAHEKLETGTSVGKITLNLE